MARKLLAHLREPFLLGVGGGEYQVVNENALNNVEIIFGQDILTLSPRETSH